MKTVRKAEQGGRLDVGTLARLALALEVAVDDVILRSSFDTDGQLARREIVERWLAAWDAQDIEAVLAVYHDSGSLHLPGAEGIPFGGDYFGTDAIRTATETAWASARTVPQGPESYRFFADDDSVIIYGPKGVHTPDGEVVQLGSFQIFIFDGDLIAEHRVEYDTLALRRIVGFPPADSAQD